MKNPLAREDFSICKICFFISNMLYCICECRRKLAFIVNNICAAKDAFGRLLFISNKKLNFKKSWVPCPYDSEGEGLKNLIFLLLYFDYVLFMLKYFYAQRNRILEKSFNFCL